MLQQTQQPIEVRTNEIAKSLAGILSYSLPLAQFFFQLFPKSVGSMFPNQEVFLITSVLTLILSFLIIILYKESPQLNIPVSFWRNKSQAEFIKRTNRSFYSPEEILEYQKNNSWPQTISFTQKHLSVILVLSIFLIGLHFIWTTVYWPQNPQGWEMFMQAVEYSLIIIFSVLASTIFYEDQVEKERTERLKKGRISKAISLAIENNAIPAVPQISFVREVESGIFTFSNYSIQIKVKNRIYRIQTDSNVEVLREVSEVSTNQNQMGGNEPSQPQ